MALRSPPRFLIPTTAVLSLPLVPVIFRFRKQPDPLWALRVEANPGEAAYLGIPKSTLHYWRSRREGPPAFKVGRHLRYMPSEVRKWLEDCRINDPDEVDKSWE